MSELFNFKRFCTYFSYDLTQMWRHNAIPVLLMGGGGLIFFLFYVSINLIIFPHFSTPDLESRAGVFLFCFFLFNLFITRTYGFLTDKKKGSDFLMLPASTLEKYISMLIITVIILPLLFTLIYFGIDAILCLRFPLSGESLFVAGRSLFVSTISPVVKWKTLLPALLMIHVFNMLYYLFCGLVFNRHKIFWAIAFGIFISIVFNYSGAGFTDISTLSQADIQLTVNHLVRAGGIRMATGIAILACAIYYTLKTTNH